MRRKKSESGASLPVGYDIPQVELFGNTRATVGECDGILEYGPELLILRSGGNVLRFCGENLNLCVLSEKNVLVRGTIRSLDFGS